MIPFVLRPWRRTDAESIAAAADNPKIAANLRNVFPSPYRLSDAEPFADNRGSRRVLEKAGFTCEGTMRNSVYKNGQVHSCCMYALLREELN